MIVVTERISSMKTMMMIRTKIEALFRSASVVAQTPPAPASTNSIAGPRGPRSGGGFGGFGAESTNIVKLGSIRLRDVCILPDQASKTYYTVHRGGVRWRGLGSRSAKGSNFAAAADFTRTAQVNRRSGGMETQ